MPSKPCLTCGVLSAGSYCRAHQPKRDTPGRGGGATASRFRAAVLDRAGHRCQWVNAEGVRCSTVSDLEAHHLVDLRRGGSNDPSNGVALCRRHHRLAARMARAG